MNPKIRRRANSAILRALGLVLVTMVVIPLPARAAPDRKMYTAIVSPASVGAGQTVGYTFSATNQSSSQSLGSINLTAPPDFTLTGVTGQPTRSSDGAPSGTATVVGTTLLEMRNLNLPPSDTVTVTFTAQAPCVQSSAAGADEWGLAAKQSNDFKGTGNDFAPSSTSQRTTDVTGSCQLGWLTQPASAKLDQTITSTLYDAIDGTIDGPSIQAQVLSAPYGDLSRSRVTFSTATVTLAIGHDPNQAPSSLSGTTSAPAVAGVATFSPGPRIGSHGLDFTLFARNSNMGQAESGEFDISDSAGVCSRGECADIRAAGPHVNAKLSSTSTTGIIAMSIGVLPELLCTGYAPNSQQEAVTILPIGVSSTSTMTVEITVLAGIVDRPASQYRVCWASTRPFTERDGTPADLATINGDLFYKGLLSDCAARNPVAPCQITPSKEDRQGNVILKVFAPGDDPHAR
jgi:hypothetical protein